MRPALILATGLVTMAAAVPAVGAPQPGPGSAHPERTHSAMMPRAVSWSHQGLTGGIKGVDVSRWQHIGPGRLDFPRLRTQGVRFVVIKAGDTDGRAHREAAYWYRTDSRAAKRAGLLVGHYYYAVPTSSSSYAASDARRQARRAVRQIGTIGRGELPLALDLESSSTYLGRRALTDWAITWLQTVERLTGRTPWFYSYTRYMEKRLLPDERLQRFPLWHANWGLYLRQRPLHVMGWPRDHARIWQFTDVGRLAGSGSTTMDLNVYRGTGAELLAEAGLGPAAAMEYDIPLD